MTKNNTLFIDWLRMWLASLANGGRWYQHAGLDASHASQHESCELLMILRP